MVRLPDQFAAGVAPSMAVRAVAPPDLGFEAKAKGISALAQGLASFAGSIGGAASAGDKQQDALDLANADTVFHGGMGALKNEIDGNMDYNTHPGIFQERTRQIAQDTLDRIRNPQARDLYSARMGTKLADAFNRMMSNVGAMRRQDDQLNFVNKLATRQSQYYTYTDPRDKENALQDIDHYVEAAKQSGLINSMQAQKYREQFIIGTLDDELKGMDPRQRYGAVYGKPWAPGQHQQGQPQPPTVMGPAGSMMGQPSSQLVPRETIGEVGGETGNEAKPLQGRLVPAIAGPQPQEGQSQTVPNPFLPGQQERSEVNAWTSEGMQPAQAPGRSTEVQQQGNLLQQQRARFAQELADNPALRQKVMAISAGENLDRNGNLAVIESMMNRASMMNTPLAQEGRTTGENGYYAGYNPRALNNPRTMAMIEQNLQTALQGSNVANYGTDNSSGAWGRARNASGMYTQVAEHGGELFSYPSRNDARGHNLYWNWREGVGGGTQENPQTGNQAVAAVSPQAGQQRYQIAQAPSGTATDAGYANAPQPLYNGQPLPQLQGRFSLLSPSQRMQILWQAEAQIHKKNTELYAQTQSDIDNGTAALAQTGQAPTAPDGTTAIDRAKSILQPQDYQKALGKWNAAQREYQVLAPLPNMSEDQWDQHLRQFSPNPADTGENYKAASAIEKRAIDEMDKIRIQRASDPAAAVDSSDEVQKVRDSLRNPVMVQQLDGSFAPAPMPSPQQTAQSIVHARLAAQDRLGIDTGDQRIVSMGEAQKLLRIGANNKDIRQLSDTDLQDRVRSAATRAEALYGPEYAERAMKESIKYLINDDMRRETAATIATAALTGKMPRSDDIRALEMAHTLDPMASMRATLSGNAGVLETRPDTSLGLPAVAAPRLPGSAQPNKQQIDFIRANPGKWQIFDREFGAGAAARALGAGTGKAIQGPVKPGFGQSVRNLFAESPEAAMFRTAPQAGTRPSEMPGVMEAGQ